jgi:uncharacterized protein YlaI
VPSRTFVTVRARIKGQKPFAVNFCPFCGARIDAPFVTRIDEHGNEHVPATPAGAA